MRLPLRLEAVARQVPPGEVVADVGTGHGLLPMALVARGIAPRVIAIDASSAALEEADRLLRETVVRGVSLRVGWGLTPLSPGEAGVVVLAGVGGETICAILAAGAAVAHAARKLVLQPQNHADRLRRWLLLHGFALVEEALVEERGHFYPVIAAAPASGLDDGGETGLAAGTMGDAAAVWPVPREADLWPGLEEWARRRGLPQLPAPWWLAVGPLLAAERHPVLTTQVRRRLNAARTLALRLEPKGTTGAAGRLPGLREEIGLLEKVCAWLSPSAQS